MSSHHFRSDDTSVSTHYRWPAYLDLLPRMACLYAQIANAAIVTHRDYRQPGDQCAPRLANEAIEMAARQARHIVFPVV